MGDIITLNNKTQENKFNRQINASSAVIFVVGDMTGSHTARSGCARAAKNQGQCTCTPYKQNTNGIKACKIFSTSTPSDNEDYGYINKYSYLRHEFEQAKRRKRRLLSSTTPREKRRAGFLHI